MNAVHSPNRSAYSCRALDETRLAEDPHPDARARPDDGRQDRLALHVAPERALDLLRQRRPLVRREARVDRALEPRHVEEHVDRDDDDEDQREEQEHERDRRALRELDPVLDVARDVARTQRVDPVVDLLAHLDPLEPVVVEPRLEAVDVALGVGLARRVLARHVVVDPLAGVPRLVEGDDADRDQERRHRRREERVYERDRERPGTFSRVTSRTSGLSMNAMTDAVRKRKRTCPSVSREQEREHEEHGQADELDPPRDLDRRAWAAHSRSYAIAIAGPDRADRLATVRSMR